MKHDIYFCVICEESKIVIQGIKVEHEHPIELIGDIWLVGQDVQEQQ